MWDLDVLNLLYKTKKKKINILQIGFMSNIESLWILNNTSSKLYIYDYWNQYTKKEDIIELPILEDKFYFNKSKDEFYEQIDEYKKNIIVFEKNKKQIKKILEKDNINFDYILINRTYLNNITDYLLLFWPFLNNKGTILINKLGKNKEDLLIIESFTKVYENDIKLKEFSDILIIEKNIETVKVPKNIQKTLNEYLTLKNFDELINIQRYKGIIKWNIKLSNKFILKTGNLIKQKYYNYIFEKKTDKYRDIVKLDPYRFWKKKTKKNLTNIMDLKKDIMKKDNKNIYNFSVNKKAGIIKNILNDKKDYAIELIYRFLKPYIEKKKNLSIFNIELKKENDFLYKLIMEKIFNNELNKIKLKFLNKSNFQYDYILDFDLIKKISKQKKNKCDVISISLLRYLYKYSKINMIDNVLEYIYIHLIYLILSIQKKNGFLLLGFIHPRTKVQIEVLSILSKYYKKVFLKKMPTPMNEHRIVIFAFGFKGIQNKILNKLDENYYPIYTKYLENNKLNIWNGTKINLPKIISIFNYNIDKTLIKNLDIYNKKYNENVVKYIKILSKLNYYLNKSNYSNEIKKYIYNFIIQYQFNLYIKLSSIFKINNQTTIDY